MYSSRDIFLKIDPESELILKKIQKKTEKGGREREGKRDEGRRDSGLVPIQTKSPGKDKRRPNPWRQPHLAILTELPSSWV